MSHFVVMVIGDDAEKQLEKYAGIYGFINLYSGVFWMLISGF